VSSANNLLSGANVPAISLIYILNKRGPRAEFCATPADMSQYAEELFLIATFCHLPFK
jgi:hypothetical protein